MDTRTIICVDLTQKLYHHCHHLHHHNHYYHNHHVIFIELTAILCTYNKLFTNNRCGLQCSVCVCGIVHSQPTCPSKVWQLCIQLLNYTSQFNTPFTRAQLQTGPSRAKPARASKASQLLFTQRVEKASQPL